MTNRLSNPVPQYTDSSGNLLSGGLLYFYVTGTTTSTNTYTDETLAVANANPVVLDSRGEAGSIFLDPAETYKVVLKDSDGNTIWTRDPVVDFSANVTAAFQIYNGNPNGNVAGNAGALGGSGASVVWDTSSNLLWVCTTTGAASAAVWTQVASVLSGAIVKSGTISPSSFSTQQDDYAPTGIGAAFAVRLTAGASSDITGIEAQTAGSELALINIGSFQITLKNADSNSSAANRFANAGDVVIHPGSACKIWYDGTSSRWRAISEPRPLEAFVVAVGDETTAITTGTGKVTWRMPYAFTVVEVRGSLSTAQTSGDILTVDVNDGGTTILSTKLTIDNGEKTSTTAAAAPVISDSALAEDAEMTIDADQVGASADAAGLKVTLLGFRS